VDTGVGDEVGDGSCTTWLDIFGGDKTPIPRNLAWRDTNPNDSIYYGRLIKIMDLHSL
jgi:hypothetical protein